MNSVKQIDFGGEGTNLVNSSSVNALAVVKKPAADNVLLSFIETVVNFRDIVRIDFVKFLVYSVIDGLETLIADTLVIRVKSNTDILNREVLYCFVHLRIRIV